LFSTSRRAVSSARQDRQAGLFTCTARYQPVRMICAIPRASLRLGWTAPEHRCA
jgi:hypothetical protein